MIRSMTGYGRFEDTLNNRKICAELRAVNHRYFEFSCRVPRAYGFLEEKLKSYVQSRVSRGKVDLFLSIEDETPPACEVEVNSALAAGYVKAIAQIGDENGLSSEITAYSIARFPDVLSVKRAISNEDTETLQAAVWNDVKTVAQGAVDAFVAMRETEGERMRADIESRLSSILSAVEYIEQRSPETVEAYRERLRTKMEEVLSASSIDENRIITEAAIFADRIAVDEETVRLRSHLKQIEQLISSSDAVGRKLDFVLQETNREINTIGSKAQDTEITRRVVDVKAELEKIREQIQNIE